MEKHTRGLRTDRVYYNNSKNNKPYELIIISNSGLHVTKNLITGDCEIYKTDEFLRNFKEITQRDVFDYIDNNDDKQHAVMMDMLGIGYICPFCGGKLCWESDFMTSEVGGLCESYILITKEDKLNYVKENEKEFKESNLLGVTDNIDDEIAKFNETNEYTYVYLREDKVVDGHVVSLYYEIDDSVIGIYRCSNCGKSYEIQDCPPSMESMYPYYSVE